MREDSIYDFLFEKELEEIHPCPELDCHGVLKLVEGYNDEMTYKCNICGNKVKKNLADLRDNGGKF